MIFSKLEDVIKCIKSSNKKIVLLSGTLGAGKTFLVKEFAKSLGIKNVTSPTFSIQNIYDNVVFHYDLYNKGANEFLALGMIEELEKDGFHFIEWGEELKQILDEFGFDYLVVNIKIENNKRIYECLRQ